MSRTHPSTDPVTPEALHPVDIAILDLLATQRVTKQYLIDQIDASHKEISQRLTVLERAGHVSVEGSQPTMVRLVRDPREG